MFKGARNRLLESNALADDTAPSYFIECLMYNVPNTLFKNSLAETYVGTVEWLSTAILGEFKCQNQIVELIGASRDQWSVGKAQAFIRALAHLWNGT